MHESKKRTFRNWIHRSELSFWFQEHKLNQ